MTLSEDYVIETSGSSSVSAEGFTPRQKVAFIIQGMGSMLSPSFNMMAECLVLRGYDTILAVRDARSHDFCRESRPLFKQNIEGLLGELAGQLSPDDVLFTAILGSSFTKTGSVYVHLHGVDSALSAVELRDLVSRIPVHHAVHYVSPDIHAGVFAKLLGDAHHPDFGNRHIAVAPTTPDVYGSSSPYHVSLGSHDRVEVATPFHAAFFDLQYHPSLEARFCNAAHYQRAAGRDTPAYMRYGAVHPREVAFRAVAHS